MTDHDLLSIHFNHIELLVPRKLVAYLEGGGIVIAFDEEDLSIQPAAYIAGGCPISITEVPQEKYIIPWLDMIVPVLDNDCVVLFY